MDTATQHRSGNKWRQSAPSEEECAIRTRALKGSQVAKMERGLRNHKLASLVNDF